MHEYYGGCYCGAIRYEISLNSPDEARTSLCHCGNCKKFTGGPFGLTTKLPLSAFSLTSGATTLHTADNGSGSLLHREFCSTCGGPICEYGDAVKESTRYVFTGTLDDWKGAVEGDGWARPKGEFFTEKRAEWEKPVDRCFQKRRIKE
ncbi:hypothetical protein JCM5296_007601 [Sporobolomyces johnsonii]